MLLALAGTAVGAMAPARQYTETEPHCDANRGQNKNFVRKTNQTKSRQKVDAKWEPHLVFLAGRAEEPLRALLHGSARLVVCAAATQRRESADIVRNKPRDGDVGSRKGSRLGKDTTTGGTSPDHSFGQGHTTTEERNRDGTGKPETSPRGVETARHERGLARAQPARVAQAALVLPRRG